MTKITRPKHDFSIRHVMSLEPKYDDISVAELRRTDRDVICSFNYTSYKGLISVPIYAFDAVAVRDYAFIGEIKKYVKQHPAA